MRPTTADSFAAAMSDIRATIAKAAERSGRKGSDVEVVAVSKTVPGDAVREALKSGHRLFGENRVQEAKTKWPALREDFSGVRLHLIGPLQTNKTADAVALFDAIETVDREKLAISIKKECDRQDRRPQLFVQVNTGEEPQKAGIPPDRADEFIAWCRSEVGLTISGLMCIPPVDEEPALHFALLANIARRNRIKALSMGMSGDYETAVELGATLVRIGTALFGARPPTAPVLKG